jgi:hypothetical protein
MNKMMNDSKIINFNQMAYPLSKEDQKSLTLIRNSSKIQKILMMTKISKNNSPNKRILRRLLTKLVMMRMNILANRIGKISDNLNQTKDSIPSQTKKSLPNQIRKRFSKIKLRDIDVKKLNFYYFSLFNDQKAAR